MFGELAYWGVLFVSVLLFWTVPGKFRFPVISIISFCYLYSLDGSLYNADGDLVISALFTNNRIILYQLIAWTLLFYYLPAKISKFSKVRPYIIPILVISILAYLAYYKYIPSILSYIAGQPLDEGIFIPLGISYFSFKLIHYAIEVSRGNIGKHSFGHFLGYIFLFPIFTAGPIERFDHFQLEQEIAINRDLFVIGLTRIMHGLIKKFLIAGVLLVALLQGYTTVNLLENLDNLQTYTVWRFLIVSYLIVYMDFSAYSDIAIGSSRLMGLRIMENFNWPILAPNIGDFWKRWHMTLAAWCQAYVYMPALGLTRNPYLAVFMAFIAIGLWHAGSLNYLAWGLYHALGVSIYLTWTRFKRQKKLQFFNQGIMKYCGVPFTFLFISSSFAFTLTHSNGSIGEFYSALRILAKCLFITLPESGIS